MKILRILVVLLTTLTRLALLALAGAIAVPSKSTYEFAFALCFAGLLLALAAIYVCERIRRPEEARPLALLLGSLGVSALLIAVRTVQLGYLAVPIGRDNVFELLIALADDYLGYEAAAIIISILGTSLLWVAWFVTRRSPPNPSLHRTRSGGLRPPTRTGEL